MYNLIGGTEDEVQSAGTIALPTCYGLLPSPLEYISPLLLGLLAIRVVTRYNATVVSLSYQPTRLTYFKSRCVLRLALRFGHTLTYLYTRESCDSLSYQSSSYTLPYTRYYTMAAYTMAIF